MRRLFLTIIATLMAFGYSWASDYERYYQNLPTKVTPVTTFSLPENQVSLTDFGGIGDGVTLNTEIPKSHFCPAEERRRAAHRARWRMAYGAYFAERQH